mgnify:CR=1 FL=1
MDILRLNAQGLFVDILRLNNRGEVVNTLRLNALGIGRGYITVEL